MERYANNSLILRAMAEHLEAARAAMQERREKRLALLGEVRQALDDVRLELATARQFGPETRQSRVVCPRYTRPAADPVDEARHGLHEMYAITRDPALRGQLMESYDGFARSLALKFRHRDPVDDLVQVARIGLLHAIDRFDPALGRPFTLFARITITGELKRHIRDRTWGMRVPRSLQEDYLNVMRAVDELTGERSNSPSIDAIAERCGMSADRVFEAMELRISQRALSLDMPTGLGSEDQAVLELGAEDLGFSRLENHELLMHLLGRLPERDRRIIELRFIEEMTQSEIADRIGVSQMCVSRVLARTLGRLRLWARTAVA
ncbi:MAG: sigma-70 family RNA polymerase sigma factor [Actinobacteria bacterium]|nr:sigma-70 family RNA polymerase sigma factor [Actinomycetota bacterium]